MNLKKRLLLGILIFFLEVANSYGVPAYPFPIKITQKDGTTLTILKKGNQFFHYDVTEDGILIKKDNEGIYRYATLNKKGEIVITKQKARDKKLRSKEEKKLIKTLKTISSPIPFINKARQQRIKALDKPIQRTNFPKTGSPKSVVILVNFANLDFVTKDAQKEFYQLLNEKGYHKNGGTGSARDYFIDNSMGKFSPQFDVLGPYTLPHNYEYYGRNKNGFDGKAPEMIVDACREADKAGVDFTQYDTDNDGQIDNIFVYYAGHNEAENGGINTIWPHRWFIVPLTNYGGSEDDLIFDGKKVYDYACTSELKGSSGSRMCGIGTFAHEFGHVLGLTDMYPTLGQTHYTLDTWDIMNYGPYLNEGRTPPAYNAWQRFRLGFMTPKLLDSPKTVYLQPINLSNEAYLISSTNTHNLLGTNPTPTEFFLLENRQLIGWDRYLPGRGLLIFRVNFNTTTWENNAPNNDPNAMGVDLIEADGLANDYTLHGDPFPGTSNVTEYTPQLQSGTFLQDKKITNIAEEDRIISFDFKGGKKTPTIIPIGLLVDFQTAKDNTETKEIEILGKDLTNDVTVALNFANQYKIKLENESEEQWRQKIVLSPISSSIPKTKIQVKYQPNELTCNAPHSDKLIFSSENAEKKEIYFEGVTRRLKTIYPPQNLRTTNIEPEKIILAWDKVEEDGKQVAGYYLTLIAKNFNGKDSILIKDRWIVEPTDTISKLFPEQEYRIEVRASDKNKECSYRNIVSLAQTIQVKTLKFPIEDKVVCSMENGHLRIFIPKNKEGGAKHLVNIFNVFGQKVYSKTINQNILDLYNLPKNKVFIIQADKYHKKIITH